MRAAPKYNNILQGIIFVIFSIGIFIFRLLIGEVINITVQTVCFQDIRNFFICFSVIIAGDYDYGLRKSPP